MKKLFCSVFLFLLLCLQVLAVPAKPFRRVVNQPDGTGLTIMLLGDETTHYYSTVDSIPIAINCDGSCFYASWIDGRFQATDVLAHNAGERSNEEKLMLKENVPELRRQIAMRHSKATASRNRHRQARMAARAPFQSDQPAFVHPYYGNKRGLVILVNFSDKKMINSSDNVYEQFNLEGYSKNKHIGSVRDYFLKQSYGQLSIDFDVVGPYDLSQDMKYYGEDVDELGDDAHPAEMVVEACSKADAEVNFADYDWDGNGEVDQVYIIYAGYGQAQGAPTYTIWPHEWNLIEAFGSKLELDGVFINTYACSNELYGVGSSRLDCIGTSCHEFSHCLGIPDFYDTGGGDNYGMSTWSVMSSGSYNGASNYSGSVPAGFSAFERWCAGWLQPVELDAGRNIKNMPALIDQPIAYIVYNQAFRNEFYMLENRQPYSFDGYLPGHGLLVTHVDFDPLVWAFNEVNTTTANPSYTGNNHQRYTIVAADNLYTSSTRAADTFPGTGRKSQLTDSSTPRASLYHKNSDGRKYLGRPITGIDESSDGLISFVFNGGRIIPAPELNNPDQEQIGRHGFVATWNAVEGADSYTLKLSEIQNTGDLASLLLISEDFSGFENVSTSTGQNWSNRLDEVLHTTGWTGDRLYSGYHNYEYHGIKLGSTSFSGSITTPLLTPKEDVSDITVFFGAEPYNSDESPTYIVVKVVGSSGNVFAEETVKVYGDKYVVHVNNVDEPFTVTFSTTNSPKRALINFISIYEADIEPEELLAPRRANTQVIDNVTTPFFTFTPLREATYTLQVRAVCNDEFGGSETSDWSNKLTVDLTQATADDPVAPTPTEKRQPEAEWELTDISIELSDPHSIINPFTTNSDGTITYSSSDPSVATIDSDGNIKIVGTGFVTITATTAATLTCNATSTSFNIYIFIGDGSYKQPYSVIDALYIFDSNQATTDLVWTIGYMVDITEGGVLLLAPSADMPLDDDDAENTILMVNLTEHPQLETFRSMLASAVGTQVLVLATIDQVLNICCLSTVEDIQLADGTSVGIEREAWSVKREANVYDIIGRKIQSSNFNLQTSPGIYILNNRKVIIR